MFEDWERESDVDSVSKRERGEETGRISHPSTKLLFGTGVDVTPEPVLLLLLGTGIDVTPERRLTQGCVILLNNTLIFYVRGGPQCGSFQGSQLGSPRRVDFFPEIHLLLLIKGRDSAL